MEMYDSKADRALMQFTLQKELQKGEMQKIHEVVSPVPEFVFGCRALTTCRREIKELPPASSSMRYKRKTKSAPEPGAGYECFASVDMG